MPDGDAGLAEGVVRTGRDTALALGERAQRHGADRRVEHAGADQRHDLARQEDPARASRCRRSCSISMPMATSTRPPLTITRAEIRLAELRARTGHEERDRPCPACRRGPPRRRTGAARSAGRAWCRGRRRRTTRRWRRRRPALAAKERFLNGTSGSIGSRTRRSIDGEGGQQRDRAAELDEDRCAGPAVLVVAAQEREHEQEQAAAEDELSRPSRSSGPRGRATPRPSATVATSASRPSGTLIRKIERQPKPLVSAPPTSGPTANEAPIVAP